MRRIIGWATSSDTFAATHVIKRIALAALIIAVLIGGMSTAMATVIKFDFSFAGESESGSGTLEAIDNGDGSFTAISGFGTETGALTDSFTLFSNPNASSVSISPSGFFFYDNLLFPTNLDLLISNSGLLFTTTTGRELNLFSNGPSNYTDYENNGFNIQTSFHLTAVADPILTNSLPELSDPSIITAIPEPSSIALLALGFLGLCLARRKTIKSEQP